MDCNKEEALRAKDIAEKKMENRDFVGARKIALKAQQLYPDLENIAQMLVVCDVHCSAEQKSFGNEKDWYEILQVEQKASDAIIKKQYRKLALQLHPDKNKFSGAEAAFKLIGEAQRVLLDREKRSLHDMKRRVQMNKAGASRFNSTMRSNVRPNFTSSNAQQQQQQQQPTQQQQQQQPTQQQQQQQQQQPTQQQRNGACPTFWTACPFCSVKYQYYKLILRRSLRCQNCHRPFIAHEVDRQGKSSPASNSTRQASGQQKEGKNHGAFSAGSQGNSHAEKSNTGPNDKKGTTNVSGKPNGKRKRKRVEESSESSDSKNSSDSEGDIVADRGDFSSVENHSTFRKECPRRSPRKKHPVSYKENVRNKENGESHGETTKMNDQNGLASDVKGDHKEVKLKQHLYSEESLFNRNEKAKTVKGNGVVGGSKQMDETSNHSPDSTSKEANHPNVYVYPDAEFSDFDEDKKKECFATGQIWAVYDTTDGMPRFYALIRKVLSPEFRLQITWFEPHPSCKDEISWVNEQLPVACGKYKLGYNDITDDHLMFSHLVLCEKFGRNTFKVYPRKGETWALFKNWDIKWYLDVESHQQYEFEFVEILTDYVEGEGVYVAYLAKLEGFVSLFFRNMNKENKSFQIPPLELFRFSHRVPSFKLTGEEGVGVPTGSYELDSAALPENLDDVAVAGNLDVKVGHSSFGSENTRSSGRSEPLMTSDRDASIPRVNLERSNFARQNENSVEDSDKSGAPPASKSETIEIPDTQFFNFDTGRSLDKFQIGQIWAFYSDEDVLPKYYGHINKIETSPDLQLHVSWLTCYWLPDNTIKWEDRDMLISCGRFKVNKKHEFLSVYSSTSSISHQVRAEVVGKNNKNYAILPRKGEVWAIYREWTNNIKCSELKNWEFDIVEVVEETNLFINVVVLEFVSGYSSLFREKSSEGSSVNIRIPRKELLKFSHQIPAFKLTEEYGNLRGFWELDPGALPVNYYGKR